MSIATFLNDRRAGFIMRWHARQTIRAETLAEHHFFTTHDALVIADALRYYGIAEPDTMTVLLLAHFHDAAEFESGDVSGRAKREYPALRKVSHEVERHIVEHVLFNDLPTDLADRYRDFARRAIDDPVTLEQQIVKYADKLEALKFAETEVNVGNSLMTDVVTEVQNECRALDWDWIIRLRRETGLP